MRNYSVSALQMMTIFAGYLGEDSGNNGNNPDP